MNEAPHWACCLGRCPQPGREQRERVPGRWGVNKHDLPVTPGEF